MRNLASYGKEIGIGFSSVLFVFLLYIGVSPMPLITIMLVAGVVLFMAKTRGGLAIGGNGGKKAQTKSPAYLSFDDIGGQEQAKKELMEALEFLIKREEIKKLGIRPLKGILLTGPPGTGKTLLAKAAAHYTESAFVAASGSEFVEMYVGVGASRIRNLFKEARSLAMKQKRNSAIVFIDEIDAIGGKRDGGQHREYDQTLNQLLTEMDGIQGDESIRLLLIAATNRKELLDPALLRPGRFDRHIQVDLPDKKGRAHILRLHARNKPLHEEVSLDQIARDRGEHRGGAGGAAARQAGPKGTCACSTSRVSRSCWRARLHERRVRFMSARLARLAEQSRSRSSRCSPSGAQLGEARTTRSGARCTT